MMVPDILRRMRSFCIAHYQRYRWCQKRHRNGAPDRPPWLESSSNASFAIGSARSSAFLVTAISSPAFHAESVADLPHRDCNPKHELPTQEHDIDTTLAERGEGMRHAPADQAYDPGQDRNAHERRSNGRRD